MCDNCIHKPVCAKYTATGGHVNKCEHFKEERRGKWVYTGEVEDLVNKHGAIYAKAKLMERVTKITGIEVKPVYEEEMRQARLENEAAGIHFPPDDPDKW